MTEPRNDDAHPAEPTASSESRGLPKRLRGLTVAQDEIPPAAAGRSAPERQARALENVRRCAQIAEENRGREIVLLDLRDATPLVDYFLIITAVSRRQSSAIASDIDAQMKRAGERKIGIEGSDEGRWTLIDYGDFVVHVFSEEAREYYALEDVWGNCPQLDWQEPGASARPEPEAGPPGGDTGNVEEPHPEG